MRKISAEEADKRPLDDARQDPPAQIVSDPPAREAVAVASPPKPKPDPVQVDMRRLLPQQFVVLDLETTGLHASTCEIIEIGAVKVTLDESEHPSFQILVKPRKKVSAKIVSITGITQQMLDEQGVEIEDAMSQFIEFIGDLPLVTYNAAFDMPFLWAAASKSGVVVENRYTCALKRARRAFPWMENHKLVTVAAHLNAPDNDHHRALADSIRATHVFWHATKQLNMKVQWKKYGAI